MEGLQPQVQSNPQKSNPQQPLSEDQLDLINYGLRYRTNLPGQEWLPEELKGDSISNYGYAPYNLPMGGNTQREEEIKEEGSSLENREGMPYFERGNIEPQEKIMERWLSNHRSEADKRRLLSSPSPFRGRNQIHWEMLPPSEYGIENLYDKENSDLSPELINEFNAIVKELRADPKINHLITEIEKGGKIAFIMDEEAKNPYYDPNRKCIGIPADYMNNSDKKTPLLEELIHRGQHLIYGDKMGEINPRTIEAEAKMFQDLHSMENISLLRPSKLYNGIEEAYTEDLYDFIEYGKELPPGFFKYWGDQMPSNKIAGSKAPIDENFSSKLLDYYYGYKTKK